MTHPRFAADVMLGKLAKWLRLSGFDTYYSNRAVDAELHDLSLAEERVLLTRDHLLARSLPEGRSYLVRSDRVGEQLAEVGAAFGLSATRLPPRCSLCNGTLAEAEKETLAGMVPPYVWRTQREFSRCRSCGQLYWPGTHLEKIRRFLEKSAAPG